MNNCLYTTNDINYIVDIFDNKDFSIKGNISKFKDYALPLNIYNAFDNLAYLSDYIEENININQTLKSNIESAEIKTKLATIPFLQYVDIEEKFRDWTVISHLVDKYTNMAIEYTFPLLNSNEKMKLIDLIQKHRHEVCATSSQIQTNNTDLHMNNLRNEQQNNFGVKYGGKRKSRKSRKSRKNRKSRRN
jgi:hypothetical protein